MMLFGLTDNMHSLLSSEFHAMTIVAPLQTALSGIMHLSPLSIICVAVSIATILMALLYESWVCSKFASSIPGTLGLPFIGGEGLDLIKCGSLSSFVQQRHQRYGDVFKTRLFGDLAAVFVSGPDNIRAVLRTEFDDVIFHLKPERVNEIIYAGTDNERDVRIDDIVICDACNYISNPMITIYSNLQMIEPELHHERRKLLARVLGTKSMVQHVSRLREENQNRLHEFATNHDDGFDMPNLALSLSKGMVRAALIHSITDEELELLSNTILKALNNAPNPLYQFGSMKAQADRDLEKARHLLQRLCEERMLQNQRHGHDLGTDLCKSVLKQVENPTAKTIRKIAVNSLVEVYPAIAGTTSLITSLLFELALNPDVVQQIRDHLHGLDDKGLAHDNDTITSHKDDAIMMKLKFLDNIVEAAVARNPPFTVIQRKALRPLCIQGHMIRPGTPIMLSLRHSTLNSYERQHCKKPISSSLDNTNQSMKVCTALSKQEVMTFGTGKRFCLGQYLVKMQLKLVILDVVRNFDIENLQKELQHMPRFQSPMTQIGVCPTTELKVRLRPRHSRSQ